MNIRFTGLSLVLSLFIAVALVGCGLNVSSSNAQAAPVYCSQVEVKAAEHSALLLNPDGAHIPIPPQEPEVVATVHGQSITAARLEMMVQSTVSNNQRTLARLGKEIPPNLKEQLTRSPAEIRQMLLTQLIDNVIWLAQGQQNGEYASVAEAQNHLKQSLNTLHHLSAHDPARIQFEAYLCANHLTEASYLTNSRVLQATQASLTIASAKAHIRSTLLEEGQQNVNSAENKYIQSLWSKNNVKVFLVGFTPLRAS